MKISIKTKLVAGLMVTMAPPVLAIFLVMAWTTSQQSHENFVRSTAKELQHISGTIQTFLDESRLNSTIITSDPLLQRIGPSLTSYLDTTSDNTTQTRPDDLLGQDIVSLLRRIQDSHPNYVDVFLGTRYGGFLIANSISLPAGYDPRIRPWYKQALQNPGQPRSRGVPSESEAGRGGVGFTFRPPRNGGITGPLLPLRLDRRSTF
jgi:methyl-accepting chemotaxis protein